MKEPEQVLESQRPVDYEAPKLIELGSLYELTEAHCIDEHGNPLSNVFCASI